MVKYLIDTNVISNIVAQNYNDKCTDFLRTAFGQSANISIITKIESLSWIQLNKNFELILNDLINDCTIFRLTDEIAIQAIKLRRQKKSLRTPDAIIAATAINHNFTLISSDNCFVNIPDLKLINPLEL